jgi:hypothetical protein
MMRRWRLTNESRRLGLLGIIPLVIASLFVLTGCEKLTGGGWIQSQSLVLGTKATFGFTAKCKNTTIDGLPAAVFYQGQFESDDHAVNPLIRVHGDVEPDAFGTVPGETCKDLATELDPIMESGFRGTYRTQTQVVPSSQGEFAVFVADGGEPGTISGDFICVSLVGPGIDYLNCNVVQGGNIQVD